MIERSWVQISSNAGWKWCQSRARIISTPYPGSSIIEKKENKGNQMGHTKKILSNFLFTCFLILADKVYLIMKKRKNYALKKTSLIGF